MKLPAQSAPVLRPPNFPLITEIVKVGGTDEVIEHIFSNTTDPNDPAYFPQTDYDNHCHILSHAAMMRCLSRSGF